LRCNIGPSGQQHANVWICHFIDQALAKAIGQTRFQQSVATPSAWLLDYQPNFSVWGSATQDFMHCRVMAAQLTHVRIVLQ
jgi:hypothetical protein